MNLADLPSPGGAMCGNCRRRLTPIGAYSAEGVLLSVHYEHPQDFPGVHCPSTVPIPIDDDDPSAITVCDFCYTPGTSWDYPATDFATPGDDELVMIGTWAACDACHLDVEAKAWDSIIERVCAFHGWSLTTGRRRNLRHLLEAFDTHRDGPAKQIG